MVVVRPAQCNLVSLISNAFDHVRSRAVADCIMKKLAGEPAKQTVGIGRKKNPTNDDGKQTVGSDRKQGNPKDEHGAKASEARGNTDANQQNKKLLLLNYCTRTHV